VIFTPPRLGRRHLVFGATMVAIGLILMIDTFSSDVTNACIRVGLYCPTRNSWFFPNHPPEFEWMWGLVAFAIAIVWVGGSAGSWIVRTVIWHWWRKTSHQ
jgi:hypothetical protein